MMQTVDISGTLVLYNLVIGVLLMLSSNKIAVVAGSINRSRSERIERLTRVSMNTFGSCIAGLSAAIYFLFHILRIGV